MCSNRSSGSRRVLGKAPKDRDADRYEQAYAFCDLLVVGGGCRACRRRWSRGGGARVIVLEQNAHWGGRAPVDGDVIDGKPAGEWVERCAVAALGGMENVTLRTRCMAAGVYDHGYVLADERWPTTRPATGGRSIGCGASGRGRS
jgi:sarcosine oxidase, subunit alpha